MGMLVYGFSKEVEDAFMGDGVCGSGLRVCCG